MEINFKYELGQLVCAKPYRNERGTMTIPPSMERYKVLARMYSEGVRPGTKMIDAAVIYHVKIEGFLVSDKKIVTVKESDIKLWENPQTQIEEAKK